MTATIICYLAANLSHTGFIQQLFILLSAILWILLSVKIPDRLIQFMNKLTPAVFLSMPYTTHLYWPIHLKYY